MYPSSIIIAVFLMNICNGQDFYQHISEQTEISNTIDLSFDRSRCLIKIGDGRLFRVRYFRRFRYPDPKLSCVHFHCTKRGEIQLKYNISGCSFNNTCLPFGESVTDDQCRTWKCDIDYRAWINSKSIKMGIYIDRMNTKCMLNGQCRNRGEVVYDESDCITKRCTIYGRPLGKWTLGYIQYWKPQISGCKVGGKCYKHEDSYKVGCTTYRCNNDITTTDRLLPDGRYIKEHTTTGGEDVVSTGCKRFNSPGCLQTGDHTSFGQCIEYTCMENGTNVLTKEGCPNALTKQCGPLGDVITPLPCVKLQCSKLDTEYTYQYTSERCFNDVNCTAVGEIGYEPKSNCFKTCIKSLLNGMVLYRLGGDCKVVDQPQTNMQTTQTP